MADPIPNDTGGVTARQIKLRREAQADAVSKTLSEKVRKPDDSEPQGLGDLE